MITSGVSTVWADGLVGDVCRFWFRGASSLEVVREDGDRCSSLAGGEALLAGHPVMLGAALTLAE
jgi:hypothetical protein